MEPDNTDSLTPISIGTVCKILHALGGSSVIVENGAPLSISFKYDDMSYWLVLDELPFISLVLAVDFNPEDEDVELMKDAAQYVSIHSFGAVVYVIPEDAYWLVGYDIYADSESYLQKNLNVFLDVLGNVGWYFYDYYHRLKSKHSKR